MHHIIATMLTERRRAKRAAAGPMTADDVPTMRETPNGAIVNAAFLNALDDLFTGDDDAAVINRHRARGILIAWGITGDAVDALLEQLCEPPAPVEPIAAPVRLRVVR